MSWEEAAKREQERQAKVRKQREEAKKRRMADQLRKQQADLEKKRKRQEREKWMTLRKDAARAMQEQSEAFMGGTPAPQAQAESPQSDTPQLHRGPAFGQNHYQDVKSMVPGKDAKHIPEHIRKLQEQHQRNNTAQKRFATGGVKLKRGF